MVSVAGQLGCVQARVYNPLEELLRLLRVAHWRKQGGIVDVCLPMQYSIVRAVVTSPLQGCYRGGL